MLIIEVSMFRGMSAPPWPTYSGVGIKTDCCLRSVSRTKEYRRRMASDAEEPLPQYDTLFSIGQVQTHKNESTTVGHTKMTPSAMTNFLAQIPTDISALIFLYACLPTPDPLRCLDSNPRWTRQCYPLLLGQVCKQWRRLVWTQTSELWQTIILSRN